VNSRGLLFNVNEAATYVVFCGTGLVLHDSGIAGYSPAHPHSGVFWSKASLESLAADIEAVIPITEGIASTVQCHAVLLKQVPEGLRTMTTRQLLMEHGFDAFSLVGRASQWVNWFRSHRYCGYCGELTEMEALGRFLRCHGCDHEFYPRINPCVIVLVTDGDRILLARSNRRGAVFFSCLAGFIEPGETAEEAVAREVFEEVGIQVKDIRYVKSQPWPFPSQLMLGFYASYAGGELKLCPEEIAEAHWYPVDALPDTPAPAISVAGQLITGYCSEYLQTRQK